MEKYCGSSRSSLIKKYWKLQNISHKNISKSENLMEIWESASKSKIWDPRSENRDPKSKPKYQKSWNKIQRILKTKYINNI